MGYAKRIIICAVLFLSFNVLHGQSPQPPQCISGYQETDKSATQSEVQNKIKWCASSSVGVVLYYIYRNGTFLQSIAANDNLTYTDHNRRRNVTDIYDIKAINQNGAESIAISISIPDPLDD